MTNAEKTVKLLTEFITDKQALVNMLKNKGESVSASDSLETLIDKAVALVPEGYLKPTGDYPGGIMDNGRVNVGPYEWVDVQVPTSGGDCIRQHVIEVSELPAEGAERTLYKCGDSYHKWGSWPVLKDAIQVYKTDAGDTNILVLTETSLVGVGGLYYEETYPGDSAAKISTMTIRGVYLYYIEEEDDLYVYVENGTGAYTWITVSEWMSSENEPAPAFISCLTEIPEGDLSSLEEGLYAIIGTETGWKSYGSPYMIDVTTLPTENIDENAIYRVVEEKCVDIGIYNDGEFESIGFWLALIAGSAGAYKYNILNVDSIDSVKNPEPCPSTWYYCRATRELYGYGYDDANAKWEWDTLTARLKYLSGPAVPVIENDYAYYQYHSSEFSDILLIGRYDGIVFNGPVSHLKTFSTIMSFNTIPTKVYDNTILPSTDATNESESTALHFYYIEDEDDIFTYEDCDKNGEYEWYSFASDREPGDPTISFKGFIIDESYANEPGYYAIGGSGWVKQVRPRLTRVIFDPGELVDVRDYATAKCAAPHVVVADALPEALPYPSDATYYYIEDENDILLCVLKETYTNTYEVKWETFAEHDGYTSLKFKGVVTSLNDADAEGYYAVITNGEFVDIVCYVDGIPISTAATATADGKTITLHKVDTRPNDNHIISHGVYSVGSSYYEYNGGHLDPWRRFLNPTRVETFTENKDNIDVTGHKTINIQVPEKNVQPWPKVITENGLHEASSVGLDGVSSAYVNVPDYKLLPGIAITLRGTALDFSMIPSGMSDAANIVYYDLPDTGSSEAYIGLIINNEEVKALRYNDYDNPIILYNSNGWVDTKYQRLRFIPISTAASGPLVKFIESNYAERISFSIDSSSLNADNGMTWGEWLSSSYSRGLGFVASGNNVVVDGAPSSYIVRTADDTPVLLTDSIISNHSYIV